MFFLHFCGTLCRYGIFGLSGMPYFRKYGIPNMLKQLQKKWKVNALQLVLIICTFAIGGSLTGFVGKKIMNELGIGLDWIWAVVYILLITVIWPLAVIIVSIPFGQFSFFLKYIRKIGSKFGIKND